MRRITPTGWGKEGGRPVRQLGSTEAVLEQLPEGAAIVAADGEAHERIRALRPDIRVLMASSASQTLWEVRADLPLGIDVGAFDRVRPEIYEAAYSAIRRRFPFVHWG